MKVTILVLFVTAMSLFMQTAASCAALEWVGDWEFSECWPHISGEMNNCILYKMSVRKGVKDSSVYDITINTDGYMAMQRVLARGISQGAKLSIEFVRSSPDNIDPLYRQGARLLTLSHDHGKIITEWNEFQPELSDNNKPGIYFQKVKAK